MTRELKWYTRTCLFNTDKGSNEGIEKQQQKEDMQKTNSKMQR